MNTQTQYFHETITQEKPTWLTCCKGMLHFHPFRWQFNGPFLVRAAAFCLCLLGTAGCGIAKAGTFVVNSNGNGGDSSPGDGRCRTMILSTECTLRAALEETNELAGTQTINFNLPSGSLTISPHTPLPEITGAVIIDGTTQPGFAGDTPVVILDGTSMSMPPLNDGLTIASGTSVTLRGMHILNFFANGVVNRGELTLEHMILSNNRYDGLKSDTTSGTLNVSIVDSEFAENGKAGVIGNRTNFTISSGAIADNNEGGIGVSYGSLTMTGTQIRGNTSSTDMGFGGMSISGSTYIILTGVLIENNSAHDVGGGIIFASDGGVCTLTVADSTITNNDANQGGGIFIYGGTVHLNHSTLTDNKAESDGGGIYLRPFPGSGATLWMGGGTVIGQPGHGNVADLNPDAHVGTGGGIYSEAIVNISDSTIEGNTGDGIFNNGTGSLQIQNSVIRGNSLDGIDSNSSPTSGSIQINGSTIQGNGLVGINANNANLFFIGVSILGNSEGGLQINGGTLDFSYGTVSGNTHSDDYRPGGGIGAMNLTSAHISNSTISGNHSLSNGGGLYLQAASGTVKNVTISGNRASSLGGGMVAAGDSITLNNVTLTQNTGHDSGGILGDERLTISNSLIAGNAPYNCGAPEPIVSGGHNLDDGATCGFSGPGDLSGVSAMLGPLQDNGGSTLTHALLPGSPAIDAGNDATCLPLDQRNVVRPQGAHCDIGAFEWISSTATPTPTQTPLPAGTATSSPIPTASATAVTTLVPTPTRTLSPIVFNPINFSSDQLFQGGQSCDPKTLTVQVRVTPPELVFSLGLFYKIEEKGGPGSYPWGGGLAMIPQGNGWYQLVLTGNDLPSISKWKHEAWLDFQFVANGQNNQAIAWSPVIRKVTLWQCYV